MCASDFKLLDKDHVEHAKFRRDGAMGKGILRSAATTSDRYELDFEDKSMSADEKLRIVATALFVDYLFFEGETDCLCLFCKGYCPPKPGIVDIITLHCIRSKSSFILIYFYSKTYL